MFMGALWPRIKILHHNAYSLVDCRPRWKANADTDEGNCSDKSVAPAAVVDKLHVAGSCGVFLSKGETAPRHETVARKVHLLAVPRYGPQSACRQDESRKTVADHCSSL